MKVSAAAIPALLLISTFVEINTRADDWPQWRGPGRDGVWRETGIIKAFETSRIQASWSVSISSGYSGPTVVKGRVYITDAVSDPEPAERIHCFDSMTGKAIWTHHYPCSYSGLGYQAGPRASVTINEGRAFALGAMGHFHCLDASSGEILWKKDLVRDYGIKLLQWGIAPSPLVEGDLVILQIGGADGSCVVALDKKSGRERWTSLDDPTSYASPVTIDQAGRRVLVCWTGANIAGLDPNTGEILWKHPFGHTHGWIDSIMTPAFDADHLFVSCAQDGAVMLRLLTNKAEISVAWEIFGKGGRRAKSFHSGFSSPVFVGKHLYGTDSYGRLKCLEVDSGNEVWEDRTVTSQSNWSTAHIVHNGDNVWIFNEAGELVIGKLTPTGFTELSRASLIKPTRIQFSKRSGVCWSHPAFADRHVFARNDVELICANLSANDSGRKPQVDPKTAAPPRLIAPFSAEEIKQSQKAWSAYLQTPVEYENMIGMKNVLIPPGEFSMGSSEDDIKQISREAGEWKMPSWYTDRIAGETPLHRVIITKPFYIGKFPVTVKDFRAFAKWGEYRPDPKETARGGKGYDAVGSKIESGPKYTWENPGFEQTDEHPVVNVSWNDAVGFCEFISSMEGDICRLPTEAEWEYAARCGSILQWSPSGGDNGKSANVADASFSSLKLPITLSGRIATWNDGHPFTSPVGKFRPNAFGLFDMHGNVWEWCQDRFDAKAYSRPPLENLANPVPGSERVLRGGSWNRAFPASRAAFRYRRTPSDRNLDVGFRVIQSW